MGEIVADSQQNIYEKEKPAETILDGPPGAWASEKERRFAIEMFEAFIMLRYASYRQIDAPIVYGRPQHYGHGQKYQNQGAASLQMRGIVDELNALVGSSQNLCSNACEQYTSYYRIYYSGSLVLQEEWIRCLQGPGALEDRGKISGVPPKAEGMALLHGASEGKGRLCSDRVFTWHRLEVLITGACVDLFSSKGRSARALILPEFYSVPCEGLDVLSHLK
ncbi:hypothetical protein PSPO01_01902 [Paraphaeosphaeria sporulosa]